MGMFDRVRINPKKLPVSKKEKDLIFKVNPDWQTKSLDRNLDLIQITFGGELKVYSFIKNLNNYKKVAWDRLDYTGNINFYSQVRDMWYEFDAEFKCGKLVNITYFKEPYIYNTV